MYGKIKLEVKMESVDGEERKYIRKKMVKMCTTLLKWGFIPGRVIEELE